MRDAEALMMEAHIAAAPSVIAELALLPVDAAFFIGSFVLGASITKACQ